MRILLAATFLLVMACESTAVSNQGNPPVATEYCPSQEFCKASEWCKEFGQCNSSYCGCFAAPQIAASCESMSVCSLFGECSAVGGVCKAASIEDCKKAQIPFDHYDGKGQCY